MGEITKEEAFANVLKELTKRLESIESKLEKEFPPKKEEPKEEKPEDKKKEGTGENVKLPKTTAGEASDQKPAPINDKVSVAEKALDKADIEKMVEAKTKDILKGYQTISTPRPEHSEIAKSAPIEKSFVEKALEDAKKGTWTPAQFMRTMKAEHKKEREAAMNKILN